eukprot:Sspe_Gene.85815::Locus_56578_Transcript_1_1_Confidence_1.000_Length_6232::g.85815::m.85815
MPNNKVHPAKHDPKPEGTSSEPGDQEMQPLATHEQDPAVSTPPYSPEDNAFKQQAPRAMASIAGPLSPVVAEPFASRRLWETPIKQLGGREYHRLNDADYKWVGEYFDNGTEKSLAGTVKRVFPVNAHPDTVIRSMCFIKQTAKVGLTPMHEVIFDPHKRRWLYTSKVTRGRIKPEDLKMRRDTPPTGVVRVVGDVQFADFIPKVERRVAGKIARDIASIVALQNRRGKRLSIRPLSRGLSAATGRSAGGEQRREVDLSGYEDAVATDEEDALDEVTGLGEAGDEDASFMSDLELSKHIKQYISRAIPSSCFQNGLLVVHVGHGEVAHHLAKGTEAMKTTVTTDENGDEESILRYPGAVAAIIPYSKQIESRQYFTHTIVLKDEKEVDRGGDPSVLKILDFCDRLVESLSDGYARTKLFHTKHDPKEPPSRTPIPACAVLVGGDPKLAPLELMQAVAKRHPILVIEGSKGYADILCGIITAIHDYNPNAGLDDFQRFLGTADSMTEQIIMTMLTGKLSVIVKGTKVEEFQRRLNACLRGDESLVKAWVRYAQWNENQREQAISYNFFNICILVVSILATFVAVLQTFLLLIWKRQNRSYPKSWSGIRDVSDVPSGERVVYVVYFVLTWSIIGFPIILALLQALNNKVNPGAKWVVLRMASEDLLRQIYMYRSRTLDYSAEQCKLHDPKNPGYIPPDDGLVYSTREELLSYHLNRNTDVISKSVVSRITLTTYKGVLPPDHIRKTGDTGFHDLTPDEYIKVRLRSRRAYFQAHSTRLERESRSINILIHTLSAIGTGLAAIAAYGLGYLQAWIAFTTALVNSLQRYVDFSNISRLHEQYNKTDNQLSNIEIWFAKLGDSKDNMQHRNQLVKKTEDALQEEVDMWARLLQNALEKMRKVSEEVAKERERLKELQNDKDLKEVERFKEMGLDSLRPDNIHKAFRNPTGPEARAMQKDLLKLNEEMGDILKPVRDVVESSGAKKVLMVAEQAHAVVEREGGVQAVAEKVKSALTDPHSVLKNLRSIPDAISDVVSSHSITQLIDEFLHDADLTVRTARSISHQKLSCIAANVPVLGEALQRLPQRQFLESLKGIAVQKLTELVFGDLEVKVRDIVNSADELEDFFLEMQALFGNMVTIPSEKTAILLAQIRDEGLRSRLSRLKEEHRRELFARISAFLAQAPLSIVTDFASDVESSSKNEAHHIFQIMKGLLDNCTEQIAELDIESLMEDDEERVLLWNELKDLPLRATGSIETMNKEELLKRLPSNFRDLMRDKSALQIATSIRKLIAGTPASRAFQALVSHFKDAIPELLEGLFSDPVARERFVVAAERLNQRDINKLSRQQLVKKLRVHPSFDSTLADQLSELNEESFSRILSGIQALFSNSFPGRLIDRLADELTSFDIKMLLDLEDREKLVAKMREFRDIKPKLLEMTKEELLGVVGFPCLQRKLQALTADQLKELIFTAPYLLESSHQQRIWQRITQLPQFSATGLHMTDPSVVRINLLDFTEEVVDHLFSYAQHMEAIPLDDRDYTTQLPELERFKRDTDSTALLNHIGDPILTSKLLDALPRDIIEVLKALYQTFGDPLISSVFETVGVGIEGSGKAAEYIKYADLFLTSFSPQLAADATEGVLEYSEDTRITRRRRETMLTALANISDVEIKDIQAWDGAVLRAKMEGSDRSPGITDLFGDMHGDPKRYVDDEELRDISWRLLSELTVSLPYRVFVCVCSRIHSFDVRDIFSQVFSRHLVTLLVDDLVYHGLITFTERVVMADRGGNNDDDPGMRSTTYTTTATLREVIDKISMNLSGYEFETLIPLLRDLSSDQFQKLIGMIYHVLHSTPGGRFLSTYQRIQREKMAQLYAEKKIDDPVKALVKRRKLNLALALMKGKMRTLIGKLKVKKLFCNWSAQRFLDLEELDKGRLLSQFIEDDQICELIIGLSVDELEQFLAHLKPMEESVHYASLEAARIEKVEQELFLKAVDEEPEYSDED